MTDSAATHTVVAAHKSYLSGMIREDIDIHTGCDVTKQSIIDAIDYYVKFTAKLRHRGSIHMLACLLHCYNSSDHFSFDAFNAAGGDYKNYVYQAFSPNLKTTNNLPVEVVERMSTCYRVEFVWPENGQRPVGYSRFVHYASKQYNTNASNHCQMNFLRFQKYTVIDYLKSIGFDDPKRTCSQIIKELIRRINNEDEGVDNEDEAASVADNDEDEVSIDEDEDDDDSDDEVSAVDVEDDDDSNADEVVEVEDDDDSDVDEVVEDIDAWEHVFTDHKTETDEFVQYHRSFFIRRKINDVINSSWVAHQDNLKFIPLYFVHILRWQERLQHIRPELMVRLFHPLPLHKMKACHIDIDSECLFYILDKAGLTRGKRYGNLMFPKSFASAIKSESLDLIKRWWPYVFQTDRGETNSRHHYPSLGLTTNGISASFLYWKRINVEHAPTQDAPPSQVALPTQDAPPPPPNDANVRRMIAGIDPGVASLYYLVLTNIPIDSSTMIDTSTFEVDSVPGFFEYTSGHHRHNCKSVYLMNHIRRLQKKKSLNSIYRLLSEKHLKTTKLKDFYQAVDLRVREDVRSALWEFGFTKSVLRFHLFAQGKKKSSFAAQLKKIEKAMPDNAELTVGFGNGAFPASARGRVGGAVPTRQVKEAFGQRYHTKEVDEFRTSSVCPTCDSQLYNLYHIHCSKRYYIRGIKLCRSIDCKKHPLYHRDKVGAINILKRYLVDKDILNEDLIPYFMQRTSRQDMWRRNQGRGNYKKLTTPGCKLTKKEMRKLKRERKVEKNKRSRMRKAKARKKRNNRQDLS